MMMKFINFSNLTAAIKSKETAPFDHCIVDNFFLPEVAEKLEAEFLSFDSNKWLCYQNKVENKKTLNDWNCFPALTYAVFNELNSLGMLDLFTTFTGVPLYCDHGLHGGGWHIHGNGGNLNPHLDYSIHPKLGLQRKLNIIIYLSKELLLEHRGQLGLWEHDEATKQPGQLVKEVQPIFNRAIIFDTTQHSWHGMSQQLNVPHGIYRKSLAVYYLCTPSKDASHRGRALFAPRDEQKEDLSVLELIKLRADVANSSKVYVMDKDQ